MTVSAAVCTVGPASSVTAPTPIQLARRSGGAIARSATGRSRRSTSSPSRSRRPRRRQSPTRARVRHHPRAGRPAAAPATSGAARAGDQRRDGERDLEGDQRAKPGDDAIGRPASLRGRSASASRRSSSPARACRPRWPEPDLGLHLDDRLRRAPSRALREVQLSSQLRTSPAATRRMSSFDRLAAPTPPRPRGARSRRCRHRDRARHPVTSPPPRPSRWSRRPRPRPRGAFACQRLPPCREGYPKGEEVRYSGAPWPPAVLACSSPTS